MMYLQPEPKPGDPDFWDKMREKLPKQKSHI